MLVLIVRILAVNESNVALLEVYIILLRYSNLLPTRESFIPFVTSTLSITADTRLIILLTLDSQNEKISLIQLF